jgi:hypothetical protein
MPKSTCGWWVSATSKEELWRRVEQTKQELEEDEIIKSVNEISFHQDKEHSAGLYEARLGVTYRG